MTARQAHRNGVDRRRFLTNAVIGGATIVGATALGGIDAEAAFAAPQPSLDPAFAKTSFMEGRISGIDGSLLYVVGSHGDRSRVQLTNATSVWKREPTTAAAIEPGDGMYARGVPMPDGTVAADAVWVNIVNLDTTLRGIEKNRLHLAHGNHELVGHVTRGTTNASYAGQALTSDLSRLRIGQHAQIMGAWRPSDNSIDVVRVSVGH
ncbi:cell wall protein [Streptomyces sp. M2CJ-2]|uniref:cell wall protein n=1 Tax=Streptomyces sp. M2CJ-2 TaxID=2803948 RepID=UPI0019272C60|nr:cell wall protein [Streptomyces sp. M2CJ-2]MBL3671598.1 cell wall protein [Streptomyces sp. M2CJ-2]